jgi:integrase
MLDFYVFIATVLENGPDSLKQARDGTRELFRRKKSRDPTSRPRVMRAFNRIKKKLALLKPRRPAMVLKKETVARFIKSLRQGRSLSEEARRDKALVGADLISGLRPKNLCRLRKGDFRDGAHGSYLRVGPQKNDLQASLLALGDRHAEGQEILRFVLEYIESCPVSAGDFVFRRRVRAKNGSLDWSRGGKPILPTTFSEILRSEVRKAGGSSVGDKEHRRMSGYSGRRTAAAISGWNGGTAAEIKYLLHHSKDSTIYKLYLEEPLAKDQRSRAKLNHSVKS